MSNHRRDGVLKMTIYSGDVYGLRNRSVCIHEGIKYQDDGTLSHQPESVQKPDRTAQVLSISISLEDTSYEVVDKPEWIAVSAADGGTLELTLTANETGRAERLGLTDLQDEQWSNLFHCDLPTGLTDEVAIRMGYFRIHD